ncbi:MAG: NADH:flavin oxidoreductase/NADH oxidase [Desulfomonilia bacterium]|jgi:2,4-dienoyl-CoA reductase-like NADH-dependent reductase (Old Yellow Enzyme family)
MLFDKLKIRDITFRNRIVVSPMCQYSSEDGFANDWHLVHLGSRAVGGAGLIITEATAVEARGRISPNDLGIWKDDHIPMLRRITAFMEAQGALAGMQLAHSGRKGSTYRPWEGDSSVDEHHGGWKPVVAPSAIPFSPNHAVPEALTVPEIAETVSSFAKAAQRALDAGFKVIEIHAAHGYLIHEFLSPVANKRSDDYGGPFKNRIRMVLEVVQAVRRIWPEEFPVFVRISATDWLEPEGWDLEQSVELARILKTEGVDLIDCSSGNIVPDVKIPVGPGYQVVFAERIRKETGIMTGALGLIVSPQQAETVIRTGQADVVVIARQFLRDPYWPLHAAAELKEQISWPVQYNRASV